MRDSFVRLVAVCAVTVGTVLPNALNSSAATAADEPKKPASAQAHPAAPAPAHPVAAPAGAHGSSGGTAGSQPAAGVHGATTAAHGPITTSSPGGARTSTGGAAGGHPGTAAAPGHSAASASFPGHPAPAASHELRAANGATVRTRADGSRSDIHDPQRGMTIHHGLDGNRRTVVERPDHSRVVADRGGRSYVQHPYLFHGREFGQRTYFVNGHPYDRFYGRYPYHGAYLDVYAPARYYPYGFYGYAYAPWAAPVPYAWGWGGAPWYGYYGAYYAPYPVYSAPSFWLADFVIAATLEAAFVAQAAGAELGPVPSSPPMLLEASRWIADSLVSPAAADAAALAMPSDVKQMVADEIKSMVQQEGAEAQANTANQDVDPAKGSVAQLLSDQQPHVFIAGRDIDLVTGLGQECAFNQGDVLKVTSPPAADADTVNATVLATKGKNKECPVAAAVSVAITDLQDMTNHLREQLDDGLTKLQSKQGKDGVPAAPASAVGPPVQAGFAAAAPPPDAKAGAEISQQAGQADQAERDAAVAATPAANLPGNGSSTTIAIGQSIETVTDALGSPTRIIDLGAKKIYTYPDMKVIFLNGKVANVE